MMKNPSANIWAKSPFSRKLAICLFLMTIFATTIGMALLYNAAKSNAIQMHVRISESNLEIAKLNIENQLQALENSVTGMFFNDSIVSFAFGTEQPSQLPMFYNELHRTINSILADNSALRAINIYRVDGETLTTTLPESLPFEDYSGCIRYLIKQGITNFESTTGPLWCGVISDPIQKNRKCLMNWRILRRTGKKEPDAILLLLYREPNLSNSYSYFGEKSLIIDKMGTVISAAAREQIGTWADEELWEAADASLQIPCSLTLMSSKETAFITYIPSLSGYLIAVPDDTILSGTQQAMLTTLLILSALIFLVSVACARVLSRSLTRPVYELKTAMGNVRKGDHTIRCRLYGSDELCFLAETFNHLMDDIASYIFEIRQRDNREKEGEIRLLQAQINPHLLYNTLDSALFLMTQDNISQAIRILEELSSFFKQTFRGGGLYVTLDAELQQVETYMRLQHLCRQKAIKLVVCGSPELRKARILKTTLQPIVENIYFHAFVGSICEGTVTIAFHELDKVLHISVTDNGVGMDDVSLKRLRNTLASDIMAGQSFGLWNINQRLKRTYGDDFGLTIDSKLDTFTSVMLTVPYEIHEEEKEE